MKNKMVVLPYGVKLPKDVVMNFPTPPENHALLVIKEDKRSGGKYRFHAIPLSPTPDFCNGGPILYGSINLYIGDSEDINGYFQFGGFDFSDGSWFPSVYHYWF